MATFARGGAARALSTFSSVFAPSPGSSRSRCCSAAARRSSSVCDAELRAELARGLRAQPGDVHDLDEPGRQLRPQLRERGQVAGLGVLDDLRPRSWRRSRRAASPCRRGRAARPARPTPGCARPRAGRRRGGRRRRRRARACRRAARSTRPARRSRAASGPRGDDTPVRLVVCLPTYNERENLEPMVRALGRRARRRTGSTAACS